TGVADFSETLGTSTPSGIQSEQLAVDSIARTLEANVPEIKRLKILIHGQEVDTLAGHLDLTQLFTVNTRAAPTPTLSFRLVAEAARNECQIPPRGDWGCETAEALAEVLA